ncbi:glycosyltransferase family 4 protein [Chryseolinea lacunae]|uniref:Glycosyltransferase family 4 protein n=1 Tax=Chryseolinea lacunae TaxID=2801331 RepID=A0ABS1KSP4_9BACT|nr:glycosyltransferase family 4 protein [Chryseolinea lacunae]MBL0742449.1 glycosyltransferase family 4 protein [Chryseolinea lacunae]
MKRVKVFYIISDIDKALAFEWVNDGLDKHKIELHFLLLGKTETPFIEFLRSRNTPHHVVPYRGKADLLRAWWSVFKILRNHKPDVVHTHLWIANLLGLSASWLAGIRKRIYTRHHATLHYREYPSGLKWDKLNNRLATDIVAISKSIEEILVDWDGANPAKVTRIHHGFDLHYFEAIAPETVDRLRDKYKLAGQHPVVGVIARYTPWKGIQFIIPAFKKIREKYDKGHLVLANAQGEYEGAIREMLRTLPEGSYTEIKFEANIAALYRLFDVFVHVPTDAHAEAFGQTYVEALAAGVPSVFTLSGVAREYIQHRENAMVVDFENSLQIEEAIVEILESLVLREQLTASGSDVVKSFGLGLFMERLENLYLSK